MQETVGQRHERLARGLYVLALMLEVCAPFDIVSMSMTGYTTQDGDGEIRVHLSNPSDAVVVADRLVLVPSTEWDDHDHHTWSGLHKSWVVTLVATGSHVLPGHRPVGRRDRRDPWSANDRQDPGGPTPDQVRRALMTPAGHPGPPPHVGAERRTG